MQHYTFHSGATPSATLTQVLVDGTHYCARQTGLGYLDVDGFGVGNPEIKVFHDSLTPSITLTQATLDGSHNGAFQVGQGYWRSWGYAHDRGVIGKFLGSTLSFVGYSIRKLNAIFMVPVTAVLNLAGNVFKSTVRPFTPSVSFRSDFFSNPSTIQTILIFFSSLIKFTGVSSNRSRPTIGAILSFIGGFQRPPKVKTLTAVLNFVGAFTKRTRKIVTGLVSFTTSFVNRGKLFTANLNFTGTSIRIRGKIFAPVLSFVGVIKKFSPRTLPSSLSFTTRILHSIPTFIQSFTATLSFSGFFAAGRKFLRTFTATLSFIGSITKFPKKALTATLNFTGVFKKATRRPVAAVLAFVGFFQGLSTFHNFKSLAGTLSFTGFASTTQGKVFTSILSFVGGIFRRVGLRRTGTLSFAGVIRKLSSRLHQAALSFSTFFRGVVPILAQLTGTLSFSGFISSRRGRVFAAVLSFSGAISRNIAKRFTALLLVYYSIFTPSRTKLLTGAVSFIGKSVFPTAVKKFTGVLSFFSSSIFPVSLSSTLSFADDFLIHAGNAFYRFMNSTVSFAGPTTRKLRRSFTQAVLGFRVFNWWEGPPGFTIKTIPVKSATLSFSTFLANFHTLLTQTLASTLSFVGNLGTTLLHFVKLLTSSLSFIGDFTRASGGHTYQRVLSSSLLFVGSVARGFHAVFVRIFALVSMLTESIIGKSEATYRVQDIIQPARAIQTIGTSPQLIDLSDFTSPSPCLFIKNTDNEFFVEVDTSVSFNAFPQKIPPGKGLLLAPDTTTIYARALGFPVDILLAPSLQPVTYRKSFGGTLPFNGSKVVPETFPLLLTADLPLNANLRPPEGNVLRLSGVNAYVRKDLGADQSDVWFTFGLQIPGTTETSWWADGPSGTFISLYGPSSEYIFQLYEQIETGPIRSWQLSSNNAFTSAPGPSPNVWHLCEIHIVVGVDTTIDFYVDGALVTTLTDSISTALVRNLNALGQWGGVPDDSIIYMRQVKIGTTRGGTEIFSDYFNTGDTSAWDLTNGDCTVIDPFWVDILQSVMANEISTNINVTVTVNGQVATGTVSGSSDASNNAFIGNEQIIGTTAETVLLGDIGATPVFLFIRNMDGTNFVTVDSVNTMANFPQKIFPGKGIFLYPQTGTIYIKADTAPCSVWVVAAWFVDIWIWDMANEISASLSCSISSGGQTVSGSRSFTASLSATSFIGEAITVGSTTAASVYIGGLSNPSTVMIINLDTTNFITVAGDVALAQFQQKILPGQGCLLLPETGTVYAKADTAPCLAWVVAG